jgi:hypothetical protein
MPAIAMFERGAITDPHVQVYERTSIGLMIDHDRENISILDSSLTSPVASLRKTFLSAVNGVTRRNPSKPSPPYR